MEERRGSAAKTISAVMVITLVGKVLGLYRDRLLAMPEDQFYRAQAIEYKDPPTLLLLSVLLGPLGVDRFMLGDIGMGVLKLLTGGVCGILWIIDICTIQKTVRDQNFQAIMTVM